MSDTLPDRLSADPTSPHYDAALLERGVGVRFKGVERTNVEEYCVSEGWVRLAVGNTREEAEGLYQKMVNVLDAEAKEAHQITN